MINNIYNTISEAMIILAPYARAVKTGREYLQRVFKELNFARRKSRKIKTKKDIETIEKILLLARDSMYDFIKKSKKEGTDVRLFIYKAEEVIRLIGIAIAQSRELAK